MKVYFQILFLFLTGLASPLPLSAQHSTTCKEGFENLINPPPLEIELNASVVKIDLVLNRVSEAAGFQDPYSRSLLRMAIENAIQHGVEDMYSPLSAPLKIKVVRHSTYTELKITNPIFKKFPSRLERTFKPGESVELSSDERPYPRGFGIGLGQMFRSFAKFPQGSMMGWSTQGNYATFSLRVPSK